MRAIDPVTITLADGQERKFLLTNGGVKRLKSKFGLAKLEELFKVEADDSIPSILYESQFPSKTLTLEQIEEISPGAPQEAGLILTEIFHVSFPNPPEPTQTENPQSGTGLTSGLSLVSTSE